VAVLNVGSAVDSCGPEASWLSGAAHLGGHRRVATARGGPSPERAVIRLVDLARTRHDLVLAHMKPGHLRFVVISRFTPKNTARNTQLSPSRRESRGGSAWLMSLASKHAR
jgi:hypothetical protein